jgi:hypothetical protein
MNYYEDSFGVVGKMGWVQKVGNMNFMWISKILAHSPLRELRSPPPADAHLICAAWPFVGRTGHISLAP